MLNIGVLLSNNDFRLIIDIYFNEELYTLTKVGSPKSACTSLHFN